MDIPPLAPSRLLVLIVTHTLLILMRKTSPSTTDNSLLRNGYLAELGRRLEVRISPQACDYPGPGGRPNLHHPCPRGARDMNPSPPMQPALGSRTSETRAQDPPPRFAWLHRAAPQSSVMLRAAGSELALCLCSAGEGALRPPAKWRSRTALS